MPSVTKAQHDFMQAVAHGFRPTRRKSAPSIATAREFVKADKKAGKYQKPKRASIATGGK